MGENFLNIHLVNLSQLDDFMETFSVLTYHKPYATTRIN